MASEESAQRKAHVAHALEVTIHIGLVVLLLFACFLILRPFLLIILWGVIIAVASYPAYRKLVGFLGGRGGLGAVAYVLILLAILMLPVALLTDTLVEGVGRLTATLKSGTLAIPQPPATLAQWPIIGGHLFNLWTSASTNLTDVLVRFAPQLKALVPALLAASAGIGFTVLQFVLSILVAGVLLANAEGSSGLSGSLATRLFGERGSEFEQLTVSTIRSVTSGVLGVALIQSAFATLGFVVVGLPGAGLWAMFFLFAAVLQFGALVLIPALVYVFSVASGTKAVLFLIWCIIVGSMDNILKPILLGRRAPVPIAVVFLGVLGGFMAMGIIGLFVGAIILSVGYKLFLAWLETTP